MRHLNRLSDEALLAAVALDERDALAVFVRRFQRRVFGLAMTMTGDVTLADDISQLAFERVWRHAGSYDARRAAVPTWLLTITRNLAIDALRVRRDVPRDPWAMGDLMTGASLTVDADDPLQAALATDQLGRLAPHLAALPREQRRAVLLATIGARTAAEIASIEGIPVGTAKTRIRNGLRRLRAGAAEVTQ